MAATNANRVKVLLVMPRDVRDKEGQGGGRRGVRVDIEQHIETIEMARGSTRVREGETETQDASLGEDFQRGSGILIRATILGALPSGGSIL